MKAIALHPAAKPPADDEELARAEVYGLLAALLAAPPGAELYAQLQIAATEAPAAGAFLEGSFGELVARARRLTRETVGEEYDALFQGVGKPEVLLHASYYVAGTLNDTPLVVLRDDLRALGLEPDPALATTEDHVACLCEVMRYLIAGGDERLATLAAQRRFFGAHLQGWTDALWDALATHPRSDFYRAVAGFARDFLAVEAQAFEMLDAEGS
ncbi:MAG: molecular chaperone TorD family protein [Piscinibacter sp.]|nr:molecular chaperone TorD family protein [Piscinibacter sp.]